MRLKKEGRQGLWPINLDCKIYQKMSDSSKQERAKANPVSWICLRKAYNLRSSV